ncbi:hypothetical protein EYF80_045958 [Liparis tanakae]|uniref:Uncharacterized protein n=1 Tax=Liparis tanakae TaxID=230148 RepID=A0A4Z2FT23_9TELE|nr:hypothetical protein EYF80_045958 [Liparis tanakae]
MMPHLCGGDLDRVSAPHHPGDLLQDQRHAVGILPELLHQVGFAPAHLVQGNGAYSTWREVLKLRPVGRIRPAGLSLGTTGQYQRRIVIF